MDRRRRGRRALVKQIIRNSRDSLEHSFIIESIFANFVQSVKNTQRRKHSKNLSSIARQLNHFIIEQIQLQQRSHRFESTQILNFTNLISSQHQSLNEPRPRQILEMIPRNVIEDHVQPDQRSQMREVL